MKAYQVTIFGAYASDDCVIADSMAEAEKSFLEAFPNCRIRSITQIYDNVILAFYALESGK